MKGTLPLGRIAGIRVGLHWSAPAGAVLVATALVRWRFPTAHPGEQDWLDWLLGLVVAAALLASLLGHELAHALVARRNGLRVEGITLGLPGGVVRPRDAPKDPGAELRIAVAGPLTSAVAALGATGTAAWMEVFAAPEAAVEAVLWLAAANAALALLQALPAPPLDGGRMLRAVLWRRTGDRWRAAWSAAATGRFLGWSLLFTGCAFVLLMSDLRGLGAALSGWFLIRAAAAAAREAALCTASGGAAVRRATRPASDDRPRPAGPRPMPRHRAPRSPSLADVDRRRDTPPGDAAIGAPQEPPPTGRRAPERKEEEP
ncbi:MULTISPECIES: site-2 protease family protein [unclassified Streptomyces]|uniref:site-2 protease family protein n=1 Tax=Streptomyces sp. SYP-A7185 TaxID=3040076 RepID=UPI0038F74FE6